MASLANTKYNGHQPFWFYIPFDVVYENVKINSHKNYLNFFCRLYITPQFTSAGKSSAELIKRERGRLTIEDLPGSLQVSEEHDMCPHHTVELAETQRQQLPKELGVVFSKGSDSNRPRLLLCPIYNHKHNIQCIYMYVHTYTVHICAVSRSQITYTYMHII